MAPFYQQAGQAGRSRRGIATKRLKVAHALAAALGRPGEVGGPGRGAVAGQRPSPAPAPHMHLPRRPDTSSRPDISKTALVAASRQPTVFGHPGDHLPHRSQPMIPARPSPYGVGSILDQRGRQTRPPTPHQHRPGGGETRLDLPKGQQPPHAHEPPIRSLLGPFTFPGHQLTRPRPRRIGRSRNRYSRRRVVEALLGGGGGGG